MKLITEKVSIIGAEGFIGKSLFKLLDEHYSDNFSIDGTTRKSLDITDKSKLEEYICDKKPDYLILSAGTKDVKLCEKDFNYAKCLNTDLAVNIIDIIEAHNMDTKFLYFSSDYVFDGGKGLYTVDDLPNPHTNYGKTKYLAEKAILKSNNNHKIIRTAAVLGNGANMFDWMLKNLKSNNDVNAFANTYFSPTPLSFLNKVIAEVLLNYDKIKDPILHIVPAEKLTRYELAVKIKSFITSSSVIIREDADLAFSTFQKDLSLKQSDFIKDLDTLSFEEYLQLEVERCLN